MDGDTLYRKIRLDFFQKVYSGEIKPGGQLTAERKQAQELSVSRGTIRKAREILAEEGYIASTQGSGAVYTPLVNRKSAEPEIIAVVVPVHNPFFMSYYRAFEKEAESRDILVVIKQLDHHNVDRLKDVLFSLFMKGIRDIVFWPYDTQPDYRYIERLSGLGMNFVFFDNVRDFPYCDYVSVDNGHAVGSLYGALKNRGVKNMAYVGWDNDHMTSNTERENRFRELMEPGDRLISLPWDQEELTPAQLEQAFGGLTEGDMPGGFVCGNGHIGIRLREYLNQRGLTSLPVATVDYFEESRDLGLIAYEQPFEEMGKRTFQCFLKRYEKGRTGLGETCYIKGRMRDL
ncbi:MAG: GntR family transcriptional regulator [Spirochaetales bacterium]|nr:GntR family transcriptional regulator [Spirochaetales bacterium]